MLPGIPVPHINDLSLRVNTQPACGATPRVMGRERASAPDVAALDGARPQDAEPVLAGGKPAAGFPAHVHWVAAVEAQLSLARAIYAFRAAQQSEVCIGQQAAPADARLDLAQAHRAESERQLHAAMRRCEALFGTSCGSPEQLVAMGTPMLLLHTSRSRSGG
jgi:hypothetical protein